MKTNSGKSVTDFIYIVLIQGLNYVMPLLLIPYLVRQIGAQNFGISSFSQSFVQYFVLLINFGFDFSAVREMARASDTDLHRKIFSEVFFAKLTLFGISTLVFVIICLSAGEFRQYFFLHLLSFAAAFGYLLYPSWFFQAIGKMKLATLFNAVCKLFLALGILLTVHKPADFYRYNFFFSLSQIFLG